MVVSTLLPTQTRRAAAGDVDRLSRLSPSDPEHAALRCQVAPAYGCSTSRTVVVTHCARETCSAPPSSVSRMRTPASRQSPSAGSASSTNSGVRKKVNSA